MSTRVWTARLAGALLAVAALSGCGGGGGGGGNAGGSGNSPPPRKPAIHLSASSVTATAWFNDVGPPSAEFTFTLQDMPSDSDSFYINLQATNNAIDRLGNVFTATNGLVTINYKYPYPLGVGVYTDTIKIEVCADASCTNVLIPAVTVTSQYEVRVPVGNALPKMTVSTPEVVVHAMVNDSQGPANPRIDLTMSHVPIAPTVTVRTTANGIFDVRYFGDMNSGEISVIMRSPSGLGGGTYHDDITITACLDPECQYPFPESPLTIPVDYTVQDVVDGPYGYAMKTLRVKAHDITWDPQRSVMYLATPDYPEAGANTISVLNPQTQEIVRSVPVGKMPGIMAISDDQHYLYVDLPWDARVLRLNLPDLTTDIEIPLGVTSGNSPLSATDMTVMPGSPRTLAIVKGFDSGNYPWELAIYDDAVARPGVISNLYDPTHGVMINRLAWGATPSRLYGAANNIDHHNLYALDVTTGGVAIASTTGGIAGGRLSFDGSLLYTDSGRIYDPASGVILGTLPPPVGLTSTNYAVLPREQPGSAFVVSEYYDDARANFRMQLAVYDTATFSQVRSLPLLDTHSWYGRLIRWGANGLAFNRYSGFGYSDGEVTLIYGAFVSD